MVGAGTEKAPFGGVESPDVSPDKGGSKNVEIWFDNNLVELV